jgi:hypothetical protein
MEDERDKHDIILSRLNKFLIEVGGRKKFREDFISKCPNDFYNELRLWLLNLGETEVNPDIILRKVKHITRENKRLENRKRKREEQENSSIPLTDLTSKKILLIFDLNKVVLSRKPNSLSYTIRPYAIDFIKKISIFFHIAVWTSGKRQNVTKMYTHVFGCIEPLFFWCQDKCKIYNNEVEIEDLNDGVLTSKRNTYRKKLIFCKPLKDVWRTYPEFNQTNTVFFF